MQIFAYTNCPEFQVLLESECKEITGTRPVIHAAIEELKNFLDMFQSIDVLILDSPEDSSLLNEMKMILTESKNRIGQVMLLGSDHIRGGNIRSFTRLEIPTLFEELRSFCNPASSYHEWTLVPLSALVHFQILHFDLYTSEGERSFKKVVSAYEELNPDVLKYLKTVEKIYCKKKYNRDFSMMLINSMINRIDRNYDSASEKHQSHAEVFETLKEMVLSIGLNNRLLEVCNTLVESMFQEALNLNKVFVESVRSQDELSFPYRFLILTNYVGSLLIKKLNFNSKEAELKKIIYASFFSDILLKKNEYYFVRESADFSALSEEAQDNINNHAYEAFVMLSNSSGLLKSIAPIVCQHHGSMSGVGLPENLPSELGTLAKILLISQELALALLLDKDGSEVKVVKEFLNKQRDKELHSIIVQIRDIYYSRKT